MRAPFVVRKCRVCSLRWAQREGVCRRCWREAAKEADLSAAVRQMRADEYERQRRMELLKRPPPPPREVTIDGVTFVVTWDGSRAGPGKGAA